MVRPVPSTSDVVRLLVLACFVPEGELDSVPESEFVVDDTKMVLDNVFCAADGVCDFSILEALGDEFDNPLLSLVGHAPAVTLVSRHSCLRYKRVASLTRLIPLFMPK
jgi:hypothetical protein